MNLSLKSRRIEFTPTTPSVALRATRKNFSENPSVSYLSRWADLNEDGVGEGAAGPFPCRRVARGAVSAEWALHVGRERNMSRAHIPRANQRFRAAARRTVGPQGAEP